MSISFDSILSFHCSAESSDHVSLTGSLTTPQSNPTQVESAMEDSVCHVEFFEAFPPICARNLGAFDVHLVNGMRAVS